MGQHLAPSWPAFRRWWREGTNTRPTAGEARTALEKHMPELVPSWGRLTAMLLMIPRRPRAGVVEPAALPDRLLASGGPAGRTGPGPQLRLGLPAVRRGGGQDGVCRPRGARHARLPLGTAGRDQRRRAGRVAGLRGTATGGRGLRDPAGDPVRPRGLRGTSRRPCKCCAGCPSTCPTTSHVLDGSGRWATAYLAPDRRPASRTGPWSPTIRARGNGRRTPRRSAVQSARSTLRSYWPQGSRRLRRHRSLPGFTALRHPLPRRLRDPVHRRVPACRGQRGVTTGRASPGSSPWASSSPVVSGSVSEPRNSACQMTRQTRPTWPGSAWTLPRSGVTDSAAGWRVIRSRSRGPEAAA